MKYTLVIRFSATRPVADLEIPLTINFEKDDVNTLVNVRWIKNMIRSKVESSSHHRLRLIYNGRILNDNTNFKAEVFDPKSRQAKDGDATNTDERIYIHCVIGEELTQEQLAQETQLDNRPQEVSTTPQVIGFDRLLQQGFSQDDINDLRRQFHSIYSAGLPNSGSGDIQDVEEEERREQTVRQMEERWIESTVNGSENTPGSAAGTAGATARPTNATEGEILATQEQPQQGDLDDLHVNEDLLLGVGLGIFLGVVSIVFVVVDDTVFSKRQKMSIFAGIFINYSFAIVRGKWI